MRGFSKSVISYVFISFTTTVLTLSQLLEGNFKYIVVIGRDVLTLLDYRKNFSPVFDPFIKELLVKKNEIFLFLITFDFNYIYLHI